MLREAVPAQSDVCAVRTAPAKWRALWFLLLPAISVVVYGLFAHARGPFYLGCNSDPDYAYLCNSLNIAMGRAPHLVNHPGTPLQVLGALVIRATHPFAGSKEVADAVLRNPEPYLRWTSFLLAVIYTISLGLVGVLIWRRTGEWQAALLLQAAPFLLGHEFRMVARVSAETLLLIVAVLMAGSLFLAAWAERPTPRMICALGFLAALGTTAKLSFLPLALVSLCSLPDRKQRFHCLLWFGAFTLICLLPLARHKGRLASYVHGLIFRQGNHGFGEPGVLPPEYLSTLLRLLTENPWLCLVVGLSWATFLYGCTRWKRTALHDRRWLLLLGGLTFAQTLQMLMVTKYGDWRYLLPALMFCALNLLLLLKFWQAKLPKQRSIVSGAGFIAVLGAAITLRAHYLHFAAISAGRMEIAHALQTRFKEEPIVFYYNASFPAHALWFGNFWAGGRHTKALAEILRSHPPTYWIHGAAGEVFFEGRKLTNLRDFGAYQSSFILVGSAGLRKQIAAFLPASARVQTHLERNGEVITRVTLPTSAQ